MTERDADWVEFATTQEPERKRMIAKWIGNREIAVSIHDGTIRAFSNVCPHKGGPLNEGQWLDRARVRCPWHGYVFDVATGRCLNRPGLAVRRSRWVERDGTILVSPNSPEP
jgi:nitrite reductase/ring-hydroxylating ferredoxin subunit